MKALSFSETNRRQIAPVALSILFIASLGYAWSGVGYGAGDSERYLGAALRWLEDPSLGDTHWSLRHLFVLPIAASFALFGVNATAATLPNIIYAACTTYVTWRFGRRYMGESAGAIAAAFIATSAFFLAQTVEVDVLGAEVFFLVLSIWVFIGSADTALSLSSPTVGAPPAAAAVGSSLTAVGRHPARSGALTDQGKRPKQQSRTGDFLRQARSGLRPGEASLLVAGLFAGLASSVREPAICLLIVFGLLILTRSRQPIRALMLVGAGFGAVIAIELISYTVAAGDPFYRYRIDLFHREIAFNAEMTPERAAIPARMARAATHLAATPATTPMLIFAAVSLAYLRFVRTPPRNASLALKFFGVAALVTAVLTPLLFNLSSTRYYPVFTYFCVLVTAAAVAVMWEKKQRGAAIASGLLVIFGNAAAADFARDAGYDDARLLAATAAEATEPIYSDPLTAFRSRYQMLLLGLPVSAAWSKAFNARDAAPGSLLFLTSRMTRPNAPLCVISVSPARDPWSYRLLRNSGLAKILGRRLEEAVSPPPPVAFARLLTQPTAYDPMTGKTCIASNALDQLGTRS